MVRVRHDLDTPLLQRKSTGEPGSRAGGHSTSELGWKHPLDLVFGFVVTVWSTLRVLARERLKFLEVPPYSVLPHPQAADADSNLHEYIVATMTGRRSAERETMTERGPRLTWRMRGSIHRSRRPKSYCRRNRRREGP